MAATAKKMAETALAPVELGRDYLALTSSMQDLGDLIGEFLEDGLQEGDLDQIKIPTGGGLQWELPSSAGGGVANTFDGVIVGSRTTRTYWPESFSGTSVPPDCTSRDGKTGTGNPGGVCELCPQNMWGSGKNGVGMGCSKRKRVYVLRPEGLLPVILNLPVTSIQNLRKYQIRLLSQRAPLNVVVTRFSLERTKNKAGIQYSQAVFASVGPLPDTLAPLAKAYATAIQAAMGMQAAARAPTGSAAFDAGEDAPQVDADGIPESDPPFGRFAETQVRPVRSQEGTDSEIPF